MIRHLENGFAALIIRLTEIEVQARDFVISATFPVPPLGSPNEIILVPRLAAGAG